MSEGTIIQHVALEYSHGETADLFFKEILGMEKVKTTPLPRVLSFSIFGIDTDVEIVVYASELSRFEVFVHAKRHEPSYGHVGLKVPDKDEFVARCKKHGLKPFFIQKNDKQLLFVRDFSGNLFEIQEK
jgi:catechol 2,3-dioxygenase-like lactoylglutathione lyase family enzyme